MKRAMVLAAVGIAAVAGLVLTGPVDDQGRPYYVEGPALLPAVMVCAEGLDGSPGVACFHADDVPPVAPPAPAPVESPGVTATYAPPVAATPLPELPGEPETVRPAAPVNDPGPAPVTEILPGFVDGCLSSGGLAWGHTIQDTCTWYAPDGSWVDSQGGSGPATVTP